MTYPCSGCGKFAFHVPTTCCWCRDTRTPEEIQASVQRGIEENLAKASARIAQMRIKQEEEDMRSGKRRRKTHRRR